MVSDLLSKQLQATLPQQTKALLRDAQFNPKWLVGHAREHEGLIFPSGTGQEKVGFHDSHGRFQERFVVTKAANGIAIKYRDLRDSKRPADPRSFSVCDRSPSSKDFLDQAFGIPRELLRLKTSQWLAPQKLIVIPAKIADGPNGSALDVAYIAPEGLAWAKLAWDLIHRTPAKERLLEDFRPQAVFYAVPGLNSCLFNENQATVFHRDFDGIVEVTSNSCYQGLGMSKKPIFVLLSHKMVMEGKGWLAHGTLASLTGTNVHGQQVSKGMMYQAASGHGKTEFSYTREGKISVGLRKDGEHIWIEYPANVRPDLVCGGDDGVLLRDFTSGNGFGVAENSEKGGLFDRPSGSHKLGDLLLNDEMFRLAHQDPFRQLTLNLQAEPGQKMFAFLREADSDRPRHSNPRQTFTWEDFNNSSVLQSQRVSATTDPITFDTSIFGMGVTPQTAVISWINRLPLCAAYTLMLAGVCRSKSVSVTDNGQHADHGLKLDKFGTMESFTINPDVDNANRLWEFYRDLVQVEHYTTPIGNVGPNYQVEDNEAELLARDFLYQQKAGRADAKFVPSKCPFFGLHPENAQFLNQTLPPDYNDPYQQYPTKDGYIAACTKILDLIRDGLVTILNDPKLNPQAKAAISKALSVPIFVDDAEQGQRIFDDLNRIPLVNVT